MSSPYGSLPSVVGEFIEVPFVYRQICDELPQTETRLADEADAKWFEFGFTAPEELVGNAETNWVDAAGEISWKIQSSYDLLTWEEDKMTDCTTTAIDNMDGTFTFWARRTIPLFWKSVVIDLTVESNRYGKSITGITLFQTAVSLPNYPYAMPSQASQLQTDLRAAGYTGATVTSSSASLTAGAVNHTVDGRKLLQVTHSGATVTAVTPFGGSAISLPNYPYALPGDRALLQSDLRTAGQTGAVVMLYKDPWTIFLPDRSASGLVRDLVLNITPDDPYPAWDGFGNYIGLASSAFVVGSFDNVRSTGLTPLPEAGKCFFRVKRTSLPI